MAASWLMLIIVGIVIWAATLPDVFPAGMRAFARVIAGIFIGVGLLLLLFGMMGSELPR